MILDPQSDAIPPEFLLSLLSQVGVGAFTYLRETGSTNSVALARLADDAPTGVWLILADRQSAGRGRGDNRWWSEVGSLTCSLIVDADQFQLPQSLWPRLSMAVGIAICKVLERDPWRLAMQLKWPNDVYVEGKKLGGILIEHLEKKLVIGIGLNVNQRFEGAPRNVAERATSLLIEKGQACDRYALLAELTGAVVEMLPLVACNDIDIADEASDRNLLLWKRVTIRQGTSSVVGVCEGVDTDGALLLRSEAGRVRVLSGTVELSGN